MVVFTLPCATDPIAGVIPAHVRVVEFRGVYREGHIGTRFFGRYLPENWHHASDAHSTGFMYGYRELLENGSYVSRADGGSVTVESRPA